MEESKTESAKLSDWLSYHRLLVDDIKYAKSQQWSLTYYTLLLLATVVGLSKTLGSGPEVKIILFLVALIIAVAGTHFLRKFQKDLTRYRQNISKVREKFPKDLKKIADYVPAEGDPTYYADFLHLLIGAIWVAAIFTAWAINFLDLILCK
jgi:uncharacterized membrane protein